MSSNLTRESLDAMGVSGILNALADGAYLTDKDRRILFWNEAASRITGWPAGEVTGQTCFDNVLVHVDQDGHRLCGEEHCPLHRAIVTGETSGEPIVVFAQHRGGERIPVEVSVSPIHDRDGQVVGGIETFRDLTPFVADLRRARLIQSQMLSGNGLEDPRMSIEVRHTPHDLVGGDFYRFGRVGADRVAVFLADVMGHGLASALYTMQLRVLWDDAKDLLKTPDGFMAEVNERLVPLVREEGYFATAVLAVIDLVDGSVQMVRAGHPGPLVRRRGGAIEVLGQASPALGLLKDAQYRVTTDYLGLGDSVLLYTDGAEETGSDQVEDLGAEGLRGLLGRLCEESPRPDLERLERELLQASSAIRLPDDLTLISLALNRP